MATTSSGIDRLVERFLAGQLLDQFLDRRGMRVEPPTITTSSICFDVELGIGQRGSGTA